MAKRSAKSGKKVPGTRGVQRKKSPPGKRKRKTRTKQAGAGSGHSDAAGIEFAQRKSERMLGFFSDSFTQAGDKQPDQPPSDWWIRDRLSAAKGAAAVSLVHMSGSSSAVVHQFVRSGLAIPSEAEIVALLMWLLSTGFATLTFIAAMKVILKWPWLD